MMGLITMSKKEETRIKILEAYKNKKVKTQEEAANLLNIGERQFRRILKRYNKNGAGGIVNKTRLNVGNKRMKVEKEKYIEGIIMVTEYYDFGPTFSLNVPIQIKNLWNDTSVFKLFFSSFLFSIELHFKHFFYHFILKIKQ